MIENLFAGYYLCHRLSSNKRIGVAWRGPLRMIPDIDSHPMSNASFPTEHINWKYILINYCYSMIQSSNRFEPANDIRLSKTIQRWEVNAGVESFFVVPVRVFGLRCKWIVDSAEESFVLPIRIHRSDSIASTQTQPAVRHVYILYVQCAWTFCIIGNIRRFANNFHLFFIYFHI